MRGYRPLHFLDTRWPTYWTCSQLGGISRSLFTRLNKICPYMSWWNDIWIKRRENGMVPNGHENDHLGYRPLHFVGVRWSIYRTCNHLGDKSRKLCAKLKKIRPYRIGGNDSWVKRRENGIILNECDNDHLGYRPLHFLGVRWPIYWTCNQLGDKSRKLYAKFNKIRPCRIWGNFSWVKRRENGIILNECDNDHLGYRPLHFVGARWPIYWTCSQLGDKSRKLYAKFNKICPYRIWGNDSWVKRRENGIILNECDNDHLGYRTLHFLGVRWPIYWTCSQLGDKSRKLCAKFNKLQIKHVLILIACGMGVSSLWVAFYFIMVCWSLIKWHGPVSE